MSGAKRAAWHLLQQGPYEEIVTAHGRGSEEEDEKGMLGAI